LLAEPNQSKTADAGAAEAAAPSAAGRDKSPVRKAGAKKK
jgi:hypothetical protein